jgi:acetyltransferase-like isoleucine patch superfamily enzyme
MKNTLKKIFQKVIGKYLDNLSYKMFVKAQGRFLAENENNRIESTLKIITSSEGVKISQKAIISNNLNDKSKINIGKYSYICGHLLLFKKGGKITIGNFCFIGENTKIWSAKSIVIGDRVLIAHNVNIHDNNSHSLNLKLRHNDFLNTFCNHNDEESDLNAKPIIIEDDVWIGFNSTIMKGVTIGKGAVVGACSLVLKNVKPYTVVAGNPAVEIKQI